MQFYCVDYMLKSFLFHRMRLNLILVALFVSSTLTPTVTLKNQVFNDRNTQHL